MNTTATSITALLMALMLSGAALAQDEGDNGTEFGTEMDTGTDEPVDEAEITPESDFMGRTGMSLEELVVELQMNGDNAMAINALGDMGTGGEVVIVHTADLQGVDGQNAAAVEQALAPRQATLPDLKAAVEANANVRNSLQEAGYLADNVVAVHPLSDGWMVVVVDAPF